MIGIEIIIMQVLIFIVSYEIFTNITKLIIYGETMKRDEQKGAESEK